MFYNVLFFYSFPGKLIKFAKTDTTELFIIICNFISPALQVVISYLNLTTVTLHLIVLISYV
jgi:hypothetical protein